MEDLLATQQQIIEAIDQLLRNFKKDGKDRKTSSYIKNRLSSLDSYWQEFQNNHIKLCKYDDKSHDYFVNDVYKQTTEFYSNTRSYIMDYLDSSDSRPDVKATLRPGTPSETPRQSPRGQMVAPQVSARMEVTTEQQSMSTGSRDQGLSSKLEELFRKQKSNFKAFSRSVSSIDLENISEKWELEDVLKTVQNRWDVIDSLHWEIDSELYEENVEYEQTFSKHEQKYQNIKKEIGRKMWSSSYREKSTPKMDVPTFNGNYHQWVSFKDLFVETVHNNRSMPNAQKMQFLKSKLKGEPERLIQHLPISSDNYQVCWDILTHRYNNTKLIFNSHVSILMNLPTIQQQSASAIKRIHDTANECLNAIKILGVDVTTWDPLIVYIIANKLDSDTHNDYVESLKNPRELPSLQDLLQFLESKFTSLESSRRKQDTGKPMIQQEKSYQNIKKPQFYKAFSSNTDSKNYTTKKSLQHGSNFRSSLPMCPVCNKNHGIFHCNTFLELQPNKKLETIEKLSLCKNCLHNHNGKECLSSKKCRNCFGDHNTILHDTYKLINAMINDVPGNSKPGPSHLEKRVHATQGASGKILLATAQVKVQASDGSYKILRALIDQGSQASLVTENAAQLLGLPRQHCKGVVFGVGAKGNTCKGMITIKLSSIHSDYSISTDVIIMTNVINNLPDKSFQKPLWEHIEHIQLADPEYYVSRPVDLLLGADIYAIILMGGIIKAAESYPIAQQTRFGWILCGNAASMKSLNCSVALFNEDDIQKFWAIEDIDDDNGMTSDDKQCLQLYNSTTQRRQDGRYVVRLPMHSDVDSKLGHSKQKAVAQFFQLERKFRKQENVAISYKSFIQEYISLGHMHLINSNKTPSYYLPHHCVQRAESTTTSLRVVFNASQPTSSGLSLNDLMYRGPNLQQDLLSLVINWRLYRYAFTADIEKMFRQIMVHHEDQKYQKIIWRESEDSPLNEYQLATVTYGTKAAPFLAMMTLKQLANDERDRYPVAAMALENQFYMDDILSGSHSIESAKQLQSDLTSLLRLGGFNLRKWTSNTPTLLSNISQDQSTKQENFDFKHLESTKALGLTWIAKRDLFTFQCTLEKLESKPTKRILLADISKIFDPLGWLAPIIIKLKLLFQNTWISVSHWDDIVPDNIFEEWKKLRADLYIINQIEIPRWIGSNGEDIIQLHGFCDASLKAYACVIYARIEQQGSTSVILLAAKTKVVPIKKLNSDVSLPRLELCGAMLLSRLMVKVKQSLKSQQLQTYGWCDSKAVLGWIQGEPHRWKPFVANRVRKITEIMPPIHWRYVKSSENPADCASRGLSASQLQQHTLWWQGPTWLNTYNAQEIGQQTIIETTLELKQSKLSHSVQQYNTNNNLIEELLNKHSNITRVSRVLAWILRWFKRDQGKQKYLTAQELRLATLKIVKHVQISEFSEEIRSLEEHKQVKSKSKILSLNPFLDDLGFLRVGGRLRNANISEDMKHPLIIPHSGHFTDLLIDHAHMKTFHGGARLTLSWLRQQYWILGGNRAVKKRIHRCVLCRRHNPVKQQQIMGDLPGSRTNPSRPFYHTGVDFTGYVDVKSGKGRGVKTTKGYVAVFVCMVTKAVHLELVSDLSSAAFLASLRRFAARKGSPKHVYSDNGTNFIGASKILEKEYLNIKAVISNEFLSEISEMQIQWHFNAPSWPSAGGLWEAAVKSLKHHLRRVVGDQKLTYEEYSTLLSQLEACLNTRPLGAITEDPNDLNYLTPSHFLASGPILTIVETERDERTRWQLTQKIFNDIWVRWRTEYLAGLSARSKWRKSYPNYQLNDIVIIHDVNLPAGKWALGRVVECHPGRDGHVRVVSIKTKNGILKRPITKLSLLPVENAEQQTSQPPQSTQTIHKKQKKQASFKASCVNFISIIFMLFMLLLTPAVDGAYNITSLQTNNSIYFDKLSDMRLIQDKWKIIAYYHMGPYWQGTKVLKSYYNYLTGLCTIIQTRSHCDVILLQLHHSIDELEYYDLMLQNQFNKSPRTRRGLIDGVGYIANSLFGVLDERFAEQYKKDISMIRANQRQMSQYWKNQTSIIEAENNVLKRVESVMDKQHKVFNQHLISLEQSSSRLASEINHIETLNEFMSTSIMANSLLMHLAQIQETLLDSVTNIQPFNVHLLTPAQLNDELSVISSQLSKELSLPIDNIQTDLPQIYKLLRAKARMTEQYFIFEIQIPLINRDSYHIYKTIPVSRRIGTNMVNVIPIENYLAMNIMKDTFIKISEYNLQKCLLLDSRRLCELQEPVYQRESDLNFCVKNTENTKCLTTISICQDTWTQLYNINTFMFTCCGHCTIRIICGSQVASEKLSGVNIIALGSDCVIKGDAFTVTAHKMHMNQINIKPDIVAIDISPVNYLINISIPTSNFSNIASHESEFKDIDEQIKQMRTASEHLEDDKLDDLSFHDVHHYVAIYIVAAVGLVLGIVAWRHARRGAPSAPAPTSSVQQRREDLELSDQCISVKAEHSVVQQCSSAIDSDQKTNSINTASSPIFTKCTFRKIDNE